MPILFVLISFVCVAQVIPGPTPPPPGPPPQVGFPIDGGLLYGMAFALFYGVKKLLLKRNNLNYLFNSASFATYFPKTSNSKLTIVPVLKV